MLLESFRVFLQQSNDRDVLSGAETLDCGKNVKFPLLTSTSEHDITRVGRGKPRHSLIAPANRAIAYLRQTFTGRYSPLC